jgi:hypothetical protein
MRKIGQETTSLEKNAMAGPQKCQFIQQVQALSSTLAD